MVEKELCLPPVSSVACSNNYWSPGDRTTNTRARGALQLGNTLVGFKVRKYKLDFKVVYVFKAMTMFD